MTDTDEWREGRPRTEALLRRERAYCTGMYFAVHRDRRRAAYYVYRLVRMWNAERKLRAYDRLFDELDA